MICWNERVRPFDGIFGVKFFVCLKEAMMGYPKPQFQ